MIDRYTPLVREVNATATMGAHPNGEYVKASEYDAAMARIASLEAQNAALLAEALAWVLKHFNTFAQPPEHLKGIVDEACLRAMTSDEDAVRLTAETCPEPCSCGEGPDYGPWHKLDCPHSKANRGTERG